MKISRYKIREKEGKKEKERKKERKKEDTKLERHGEKNRKGMMSTQPHPTKEVTKNIETY